MIDPLPHNPVDPAWHRDRETQAWHHVLNLLNDAKFTLDTSKGRRSLAQIARETSQQDGAVDVKRRMIELGLSDHALQRSMPTLMRAEVKAFVSRWFILRRHLTTLRFVSLSPVDDLLNGRVGEPLGIAQVRRALGELPPPLGSAPVTIILHSTSGFTSEARELAVKDGKRSIVLMEPTAGGGWRVSGDPEMRKSLAMLDPETLDAKSQRIATAIQEQALKLSESGISASRLAAQLQLPTKAVEEALREYAAVHPGLAAKRLDGHVVLFREALSLTTQQGAGMPIVDRLRSLFSMKGDTEKKVAFLAEKRAQLAQLRDVRYEEIAQLESRDASLRSDFAEQSNPLAKRRITSQLLTVKKDIERRQQLLTVLNQQLNVVGTHLHSLELVQQGSAAKLPSGDEIAEDAAKAEEMLAELQADSELAEGLGTAAIAGMSEEESALYEELEAMNAPAKQQPNTATVTPRKLGEPSRPLNETPMPTRKKNEPELG